LRTCRRRGSALVTSYPLSQLLELRQSNVQQIEQQLAVELAAVRAAQQGVALHRARQVACEGTIAAEQRKQHERAVHGEVLAHEFVQAGEHLLHQRSELEHLSRATSRALEELDRCVAASQITEGRLARSRRQLAAVERHQQRFLKRMQKQQETRMEEDAAEAWQASRSAHKSRGDS
jgi:hypothetical protein